jgi:hypothetical protein
MLSAQVIIWSPVTIDQSKLLEILAQSNPDGLEPIGPIFDRCEREFPEKAALHIAATQAIRRWT